MASATRSAVSGLERIAHENDVLALGTGGDERGGAADQFLDAADVFDRLRRQILGRARSLGGLLPAVERFVDRLYRRLVFHASGKKIDHLAVELVAGADFDLVETVEHIELGECDAVGAAERDRLANEHSVEPTAAARASGV